MTGIAVGHAQFLKYFHRLWGEAMMPNNLESGFRATRIHPYNPGAIPDEAYSNRHPMTKV
jgi:hypothetical protein